MADMKRTLLALLTFTAMGTATADEALRHVSFPAEFESALRLAPLRNNAGRDPNHISTGVRRDVAAATESMRGPDSIRWRPAPDGGYVARLSVISPQAASLRLALRILDLPARAELRFSGSASPGEVVGPVRGDEALASANEQGGYWTPPTNGDKQTVEIWIPEDADPSRVRVLAQSAAHLAATPSQLVATGLGPGSKLAVQAR
jgi:hypothetical protein